VRERWKDCVLAFNDSQKLGVINSLKEEFLRARRLVKIRIPIEYIDGHERDWEENTSELINFWHGIDTFNLHDVFGSLLSTESPVGSSSGFIIVPVRSTWRASTWTSSSSVVNSSRDWWDFYHWHLDVTVETGAAGVSPHWSESLESCVVMVMVVVMVPYLYRTQERVFKCSQVGWKNGLRKIIQALRIHFPLLLPRKTSPH